MIFRTKAVPTWNQLQITYGFYFTPLPLCWRSKAIPQLQLDSLRRDVPIGSIDVCRDFCRNNHQWIIVALVESRVLARWQPEHIHILQLFPDICSRVVLWKHNQIEREKSAHMLIYSQPMPWEWQGNFIAHFLMTFNKIEIFIYSATFYSMSCTFSKWLYSFLLLFRLKNNRWNAGTKCFQLISNLSSNEQNQTSSNVGKKKMQNKSDWNETTTKHPETRRALAKHTKNGFCA